MIVRKTSGVALAIAAAGLFAACQPQSQTPGVPSQSADAAGKCYGVNKCKGHGACATATHGCAGQNACKGKGWVSATKADCEAKGGKYEV